MGDTSYQDFDNPYTAPYAEVGIKPAMPGPTTSFRGYAGFWIRFLALIIDFIVLALISIPVGMLFGTFFVRSGLHGMRLGFLRLPDPMSLLIQLCYFAVMESSQSQGSLGKMALGLKVVDVQGHRISFGRAAARYLASILSAAIFLIGYIMAAFTDRKQALHDMIAGTLVIKTR